MRMRLIAAATTIVALAVPAQAQQLQPLAPAPDFDKVVIKTADLGNRTYMLEGEGGNITVAVADDGVIMVDSQFAPLYGKINVAIAALTQQPIRYLIITHFHRDHTGGNEAFGRDGATIVAHENVKTHLASGTRNGLTGNKVPPAPAIALPTETYKDTMTVRLQGRAAELKHPVDAHTDGDTYIYFADANVLVTGDIVFFGRYPNIDFLYGGSIDGMIRGVDDLLKFAKDDTKIVPGHGPVGTKATMREYRQMLVEARDRIQKLKAAGKTEDEVVAAKAERRLRCKVRLGRAGNRKLHTRDLSLAEELGRCHWLNLRLILREGEMTWEFNMPIRSIISHTAIGCGGVIAGWLIAAGQLGIMPSFAQTPEASPGQRSTELFNRVMDDVLGHRLTVRLTERDPGNGSAAHRHPGSHTVGYILEGSYEVKINDGPVQTLKPGEVFYEPPNALHAISRNASAAQPLRYLVIQVSDPTKPATVPE